MRSPAVELVLRVIADQLGTRKCEHCASPLAGGRFALREQTAQRIVVEVGCPSCGRTVVVLVQPEVDGTAQVR